MRIAIATKDQDLVEQISALAQRSGASLEVLGAAQVLADAQREIRLIECEQFGSGSAPRVAGLELRPGDWLLLLSERVAPGAGSSLQVVVAPAERRGELLDRLQEALPRRGDLLDAAEGLLGETPAMQQVKQQVRRVARFRDVSVIVIGESGTGKELVAEAIHQLASGDRDPFVAINCAAIPEDLFETELFGTDAVGAKPARVGLLEAARAGTVFLDEVGAMPLRLQPKLLRALETREFQRVGSEASIPLRARVISATSRTLGPGGGGDALLADLQFRLAGFTIAVPPLRERLEDLDALARHFVAAFGARQGISGCSISGAALLQLRQMDWPGNIRQLRSTLDHAAVLCGGDAIDVASVQTARQQLASLSSERETRTRGAAEGAAIAEVGAAAVGASGMVGAQVRGLLSEGGGLRDIERDLILAAFRESDGNLSKTSRLLGLPRTTLRAKLRRYGAL